MRLNISYPIYILYGVQTLNDQSFDMSMFK